MQAGSGAAASLVISVNHGDRLNFSWQSVSPVYPERRPIVYGRTGQTDFCISKT